MKRVGCLYRVSTKKQVSDEDDIPMQKQACTEFANRNGWVVVKEFFEKGISGYKLSANDRDVLQDLKESALKKEFDILLVFMFDRLGRRDDETPFVVEWFVKQGIEVWSVKEGQQIFENHTDKLLNYIRFWQANGESEKTSERVKTRLRQLTSEGKFTGGVVPYGYKLVETGEHNRKGNSIKKLVINESEASIVKLVFQKTVDEGLGSYALSELLNGMGLRTPSGAKFSSNYVNRMLKNKLYCGYFSAAGVTSPKQEYLEIIDENIYDAAQKIIVQRGKRQERKINVAMTTKADSLMSGNIFCGHCGSRLCTSRANYKTHVINGTPIRESRRVYICYHRSRKLNDCDGQSVYQAEKVENIVLEILHNYFKAFAKKEKVDALAQNYAKTISDRQKRIKELKSSNLDLELQLKKLSEEIGKALLGTSNFTPDMLKDAIDNVSSQRDENNFLIEQYNSEVVNVSDTMSKLEYNYTRFDECSKKFEKASLKEKKMMMCELFERIEVRRGYEITAVLNREYQQFFE